MRITDYSEGEKLQRLVQSRTDGRIKAIPVTFRKIGRDGQPVVRMADGREKPVMWRHLFKAVSDARAVADAVNAQIGK
jgi:hypothetical protein